MAQPATPDLMGMVSRQITPDVIRSVATQLSEDRGSTASALSAAVPSTLTALSDVASSDTGARHLKEVIDENLRASTHGSLDGRSLFPVSKSAAGDHAASLISDELGPRSSSIAAAVASATGVKTASAERLMSGVATVAVAALARSSGGMGAGALQSMLREQRGGWVSKLPGPVASLFNGHSGQAAHSVQAIRATERGYEERIVTGPAIRELEAPKRNWMIPLILVALALLAIPLMRGLRRPSPQLPERVTLPVPTQPAPAVTPPPVETAPAPEPAAPAPSVEPGSLADMNAFLAGSGEMTPHAFAPSPLTFSFGSSQPTPESIETIDDIAASLKEHPAATIRVESHTDNIGSQESNLNLSQARADAIKAELIDRGIGASRIETAGMGQDMPIASNDTPEGRAQNRRSEIVVTSR